MKKIGQLFHSINKSSQVLVVLWIFFSLVSIYIPSEETEDMSSLVLMCVFNTMIWGVLFLHPALLSQDYKTSVQDSVKVSLSEFSFKKTLIFAIFLGIFGVHRFYTKRYVSGIVCLITMNAAGLGLLIDILFILSGKYTDGAGRQVLTESKKILKLKTASFIQQKEKELTNVQSINISDSNTPKLYICDHDQNQVRDTIDINSSSIDCSDDESKKQVFGDVEIAGKDENTEPIIYNDNINIKNENFDAISDNNTDDYYFTYATKEKYRKFFEEMGRYENYEGEKVPFVNFSSYHSTYFDMHKEQRAYYFYWRSEVRKGKTYLNTSLSYIFVYVYELLSGIGCSSPGDGYGKLMKVWTSYRNQFPKLDEYLSEWTYDFAQLYKIHYKFPKFLDIPHQGFSIIYNEALTSLRNKRPLTLTFEQINSLIDYDMTLSSFYNKDNKKYQEEIEITIPKVVSFVDSYLWGKENAGILTQYGPKSTTFEHHAIFKSAICPKAGQDIIIYQYHFNRSNKWRKVLTQIAKHTENALREKYHVRGRVKESKAHPEIDDIIDMYFHKPLNEEKIPDKKKRTDRQEKVEQTINLSSRKVGRTVNLDLEKVSALRDESDAVRDALTVTPETIVNKISEEQAILLVESLSNSLRIFLEKLKENHWVCDASIVESQYAKEINNVAEEMFARSILFNNNGKIFVDSQWIPLIDNIELAHEESESAPISTVLHYDDSIEEIFSQLSAGQKNAINVILTGNRVASKLREIADNEFTMPDTMIDEINEIALSIMDDMLIDTSMVVPEIIDEYKERIEAVLGKE